MREHDGGWWRDTPAGPVLLFAPAFRLDRQVTGPAGCHYEGRFLPPGGAAVPFRCPCGPAETAPRATFARLARRAGLVVPPPAGGAGPSLVAVACGLSPPELVRLGRLPPGRPPDSSQRPDAGPLPAAGRWLPAGGG